MNTKFAKSKINKLCRLAKENGDGFIGCYFSRGTNQFIGQNVGMEAKDGMFLIDKIISLFNLDRAILAELIKPKSTIILPFEKKKKDG